MNSGERSACIAQQRERQSDESSGTPTVGAQTLNSRSHQSIVHLPVQCCQVGTRVLILSVDEKVPCHQRRSHVHIRKRKLLVLLREVSGLKTRISCCEGDGHSRCGARVGIGRGAPVQQPGTNIHRTSKTVQFLSYYRDSLPPPWFEYYYTSTCE